MVVRWTMLFAGAVALIVGGVGLLAPVSVSPEDRTVSCGSPIAPDLSAARDEDDRSAANFPVGNDVITDTNYTRLCEMELSDRRVWTITLVAIGTLTVAATVALRARANRTPAD